MPRPVSHCVSAVVVVLVAGLFGPKVEAQTVKFFQIATGNTVGSYFPIGRLIASAITNPPGSRTCAEGGSCGVPGLIAVAHSNLDTVTLFGAIFTLAFLGIGLTLLLSLIESKALFWHESSLIT